MSNFIDINICNKKTSLLEYYRERGLALIAESKQSFADPEYKDRATFVNKGLNEAKENLLKILKQKSKKEHWKPVKVLEGALLITYTNYVVMLEARNEVWEYDYMSFSRRIGELWEPFCLLCWDYQINDKLNYIVPPLFKDVKVKLTKEIEDFINKLSIGKKEKNELRKYYQKVWTLVTSGDISLELDLHFENGVDQFVVDFKSGFSSNEKGNTNRLLLVASIYQILEEGHKCLIFVRSPKEQNNHYLQTLRKSGLWNVYCGKETYSKIHEFTNFNLKLWMKKNIVWKSDLSPKMLNHLEEKDLTKYLEW